MAGNKTLKDLVEEGKESGFLTLEDLNKSLNASEMTAEDADGVMDTLDDLGIQVVDQKKTKNEPAEDLSASASGLDISNSIRMYLSEMGKVPLLSRDEEITLARNVREREKELRKLVLESPITMREICNWEELVDQEEMTTKELMPRGKRTTNELKNMRRKLKEAAQFIGKREKEITKLMLELRNEKLPEAKRNRYIEQLEAKQKAGRPAAQATADAALVAEIVNDKTNYSLGNPKGKYVIIEFFDHQCGWCKRTNKEMREAIAKGAKNIRWIPIDTPIFGEASETIARYVLAAGEQGKYAQMHEAVGNGILWW